MNCLYWYACVMKKKKQLKTSEEFNFYQLYVYIKYMVIPSWYARPGESL
jgi:hypothetical protein